MYLHLSGNSLKWYSCMPREKNNERSTENKKATRSRRGCEQCRRRKIKCDEVHPECGQCVRRSAKCEYISIRVSWVYQNPQYSPESSKFSTAVPPSEQRSPLRLPASESLGMQLVELGLEDDDLVSELPDVTGLHKFQMIHPIYGSYLSLCSPLPVPPTAGIPRFTPGTRHNSGAYPTVHPGPASDYQSHMQGHSDFPRPALQQELRENQFAFPPFQGATGQPGAQQQMILHRDSVPQDDQMLFDYSDAAIRQELVKHFEQETAIDLVPLPYDDNPFVKLLPKLAVHDDIVATILAAFAAHQRASATGHSGTMMGPGSSSLSYKLICECDVLLYDGLRTGRREDTWRVLLLATMLAMLNRDDATAWARYMTDAVHILDNNSVEDLLTGDHAEENSMCMRLVVSMGVIGDLCGHPRVFLSPNALLWWPQWSGSLDYLTALDLNLAPLYTEAARLIEARRNTPSHHLKQIAGILKRGLFVLQRVNDYWLEEFWPYDDITAMCILFQQALQIHVYRRLLCLPVMHPTVRRSIDLMVKFLDDLVPLTSNIQKNMTFILVTAASEAVRTEHRLSLVLRLEAMMKAGYSHAQKARREVERYWSEGRSLITDVNMWPVF